MNPLEQLEVLLKKQHVKEIIPFLQALTPTERKELVPNLKKLFKEYDRFEQVGNIYRNKLTVEQGIILSYTAFVCYNRNDFAKASSLWILAKEHLDQILPWYCPTWFSDYINSFTEQEWFPHQLNYAYLLELVQKGYLHPHPHIVARLLVPMIFENRDKKNYFVPEKLEQNLITLDEHIWYLFQYETNIHFSNRYIYFEGKKAEEERSWAAALQHYSESGRIDRLRLMKEALLASNRNFNKLLSGWFAGLFVSLKPTTAELLELQPELLLLFSSPHSKVVNAALQSVKGIVDDIAFDGMLFLDHAPLVMSSGTKSVVASGLQVLEKLGKRLKEQRSAIAVLAAQALVSKEESLQKKAAQLIRKFGEDDEELKLTVSLYGPTMFTDVKGLLSYYLGNEILHNTQGGTEESLASRSTALDETMMLNPVTDAEELLFLASQAFDNNEPHHFDQMLDALVRLQNKVNAEDAEKLQPAFQRALKLFMGDWRTGVGQLDAMLATLFLEFGQLMMRKYPHTTPSLRRLYEGFMNKSEKNKQLWGEHGNSVRFLGDWSSIKDRQIYAPHRELIEAVVDKLLKGDDAPLLNTPTHLPCWIDPKALVQRMAHYRQYDREYSQADLQIALSRCWLDDTAEALSLAEKVLEGEEKRLMQFLLDPKARPVGPFETEWAWMVAALCKKPGEVFQELGELGFSLKPRARYTGQHPWTTIVEEYETNEYKWENGTMQTIKVPAKRKVLRLDLSAYKDEVKKEGRFANWLSKFTGNGNKEAEVQQESLIFEHMRITTTFLSLEDRDIQRILFLIPNNPEPLLALAVDKCLEYPQFWSETEKRLAIELLRGLHALNRPLGEIGHLFVATCLVCSDKTAASYAAEIWVQRVREGVINSGTIGRIIGIHQQVEFVPLKRLNDLIMSQLWGISNLHNIALEEMTRHLLLHLPLAPVKHVKKLVQIYFELLALNHSKIEDKQIIEHLNRWQIKYTAPLPN